MLTEKERAERLAMFRKEAALLRADPTVPRTAFWLSFADADKPLGEQFLGGCLVDDVVNLTDAIDASHRLGINPGGEVLSCEIDVTKIPADFPRNVLLSKADLDKLGGVKKMRPDDD